MFETSTGADPGFWNMGVAKDCKVRSPFIRPWSRASLKPQDSFWWIQQFFSWSSESAGKSLENTSGGYFMKLVITDNLSFTDYYHGNSQWQCFIANQNQECHCTFQWMTNCQWWQVSWNAPQTFLQLFWMTYCNAILPSGKLSLCT